MYKVFNKNKKSGFTLIELVIVIAILAILAAILAPIMIGYINEANQSVADANSRSLYSAATAAAAMCLTDATKAADVTNKTYSSADTGEYIAQIKSLLGKNFEVANGSWKVKVSGIDLTNKVYEDMVISTMWTDTSKTGYYPAGAATDTDLQP